VLLLLLADILEASEPTWIHDINLKKFHLGEKEPDIFDIRWADRAGVLARWQVGRASR
jgi:hypothetical protein